MTESRPGANTENEVLDGAAATSMQLDFIYSRIEKEEVLPQINLWIEEYLERFDMLADAVFDTNSKKYEKVMEMFNRSKEEINKFKDDQSRIMLLTNFLMELSNQVDALIVGAQSSQLRN
ncbi:MAG: hypothetical protein KAW12_19745 [Candidatus Aminicenantes bacterium]|nr:hypothetical protein [Candidatus Aminicenantes bacterium]